jgi:hypothetical protein
MDKENQELTSNENIKPLFNQLVYEKTKSNIRKYIGASNELLYERLQELNKEWYVEKVFITLISFLIFLFSLLGLISGSFWYLINLLLAIVSFIHYVFNWSLPIYFIRRFGVRTFSEIYEEKMVIKLMMKDYINMSDKNPIDFYKEVRKHRSKVGF